jgi:glycosyltransferase involved in cell wall biosynthesis
MAVRDHPEFYAPAFVAWYRLAFARIAKAARCFITVSEFSRERIEYYYPAATHKLTVLSNAWQHIERVDADEGVWQKYGLRQKGYFFAMSSLAPNKNLNWLVETARLSPDEVIAIAGGVNARVFGKGDVPTAPNVVYLGHVSDEEAKALMQGCRAFLYPTFYEGFGIPPMEALACETSAMVSDTQVMHEIYGDAVSYCNPRQPMALPRELPRNEQAVSRVLSSYSWHRQAKALLDIMRFADASCLPDRRECIG